MSLTIKEKEHWKERIEARIMTEIKKLKSQDLDFFEDVGTEARKQAAKMLGIIEDLDKYEALQELARKKMQEANALQNSMSEQLKMNFRHLRDRYYNGDSLINQALQERIPAIEMQLLEDSELGLRILELEREKETLLDTVWLATSSPQIRDLWIQVDQLLGKESTELQANLLKQKEK